MTALHVAGGGLPLALHIPHVVEQAGSIAGFASVLGLAILSALYFSQARDLRRLREWAGRAPERAAEGQSAPAMPGRVVAVPQQRPAGPAAVPTPAPATSPANGEAAKPEEPAAAATNGDAAPSVTATSADKDSTPEGEEAKEGDAAAAKPGMPAPASAAAAAGAGSKSVAGPAAAVAPAAPGSTAPGSAGPPPSGSPGPAPGPAPAGAAAAGAAAAGAAAPAAAPPQTGGPRPPASPQRPPGSVLPPRTGTLPPVRRLPSSNVGPAQTGIIGQEPPKKKRNPLYVVLAVAGVLVLGAAAAVGVPALVNGSKNDKPSTAAKKSKTTETATNSAASVAPDKITVAVLNGTAIPGLAAQVGDRIDAEGFTLGTVSNASQTSGQRANSAALYAPGHQRDATRVAKKLGIRNISRVDPDTQSIAGDASVVVIVGTDKTQ